MLEKLITCEISWDLIQNDPQVAADISDYLKSNLTRDQQGDALIPKQESYLFGARVLEFSSGFGMSPGYMVKLESSLDEVKQNIEAQGEVEWEECDERSCARKISDTETFVIMVDGADLYAGCMYPFQR